MISNGKTFTTHNDRNSNEVKLNPSGIDEFTALKNNNNQSDEMILYYNSLEKTKDMMVNRSFKHVAKK